MVAQEESTILGYKTVRHMECQKLLPPNHPCERCSRCDSYRKTLRTILSRSSQEGGSDRSHPSSHANYRYLTSPEKNERLHRLHNLTRSSAKQLQRMKDKIAKATEAKGIEVDTTLQDDLLEIMSNNTERVTAKHPPNSFPTIFWQQQQEAAIKDPRGMRWHPLMVKWCLYLRHLSGSAYETLRTSGILKLPSQRSLRDYTHYVPASAGFSNAVDIQLMEAANIASCPEYEKNVLLIMDEMHIKESLVFNKHTGALVGFTNLGEMNEHLQKFEQSLEANDGNTQEPLAKSVLVMMVRGLFSRLQFPYAQFPCEAVSGDQLYNPFWNAVMRLERYVIARNGLTRHFIASYITCTQIFW